MVLIHPSRSLSISFPQKWRGVHPRARQFLIFDQISLDVPGYLGYPVIWIFSVFEFFLKSIPVFSVEEFRITEDCYLVLCYGDIWPPGNFL